MLLEVWDPQAALVSLARGVLHRRKAIARTWFVLWPSIPEPALYDVWSAPQVRGHAIVNVVDSSSPPRSTRAPCALAISSTM
jgi:hypothetical protein